MTHDLDQSGPIDYLVVEFPGNKMTGEAFPILVDLADRGIIRILDLAFISKGTDGSVAGLSIADIDGDGELDLAVFEGPRPGCSTAATSTRPAPCWSPAAPPACWSTRTSGPRRSRPRSDAPAASWSPAAGSRSRPCSLRSTPPSAAEPVS